MKKFTIILCFLMLISFASCKSEAKNTTKDDIPTQKSEKDETFIAPAVEDYYHLETPKGIEVYVFSMANGSFSCRLMSGTNRLKTREEFEALPIIRVEKAKEILATYDIPSSSITLLACQSMLSSYCYNLNEDYLNAVANQFDNKYSAVMAEFE